MWNILFRGPGVPEGAHEPQFELNESLWWITGYPAGAVAPPLAAAVSESLEIELRWLIVVIVDASPPWRCHQLRGDELRWQATDESVLRNLCWVSIFLFLCSSWSVTLGKADGNTRIRKKKNHRICKNVLTLLFWTEVKKSKCANRAGKNCSGCQARYLTVSVQFQGIRLGLRCLRVL